MFTRHYTKDLHRMRHPLSLKGDSCNPFLSPFTWRYEFPKEFHFELSRGKSVIVSKGWESRGVDFIRKLLRTHLDTSSWDTARGVAVPWRAREDPWRDSCEYASELFSNAETEPFCFPAKKKFYYQMRIYFIGRGQERYKRFFFYTSNDQFHQDQSLAIFGSEGKTI